MNTADYPDPIADTDVARFVDLANAHAAAALPSEVAVLDARCRDLKLCLRTGTFRPDGKTQRVGWVYRSGLHGPPWSPFFEDPIALLAWLVGYLKDPVRMGDGET